MDLTPLAKMFGLDMLSLTELAGIVTILTNVVKDKLKDKGMTGYWIYVPVIALSFALSWKTLYPSWENIIASTLAIAAISVAGWSTAKALAHKVGPSTPPAPSP